MELTVSEKSLLESMKSGKKVIVRATTGQAYIDDYICTTALEGLLKAGLVKRDKIDKDAGWVWYIPVSIR